MFSADDTKPRLHWPPSPVRPPVFRARAAAASQPEVAQFSPADGDARAGQPRPGVGFVAIGAWPVIGFFGLDVGLVYLAFRLNYRSARQSETIRLADDAFTVERVSVRGERRHWRFEPFWVRVILQERSDASNRLLVASHGRSLVIGDFAPPATRRELALTLHDALTRWRNSLNPAWQAGEALQRPSTSFSP
jgi:uncharacterized membrane protein